MIQQKRLYMHITIKPRWFKKNNTKPNSCHSYAGLHFKSECLFKSKICYFCWKLGYICSHGKKKKNFKTNCPFKSKICYASGKLGHIKTM